MATIPDEVLAEILHDDCPGADLTTEGLGLAGRRARLRLFARGEMVLCGVEEAARMFALAGAVAEAAVSNGDRVVAGTLLLEASGTAGILHRTYRMAQTLIETLSGMASAAQAIVDAAHSANPVTRVACTRKHLPGMKRLALHAIAAGGAVPHRRSLSDSLLVFDSHLALLDDGRPLAEHFASLRAAAPGQPLIAEAASLTQALVLAEAGADMVQVDKLSPDQVAAVAQALAQLQPRPQLAAAGGITAANAAAYAAAGADLLVTSSPYYAGPRDVKAEIDRA